MLCLWEGKKNVFHYSLWLVVIVITAESKSGQCVRTVCLCELMKRRQREKERERVTEHSLLLLNHVVFVCLFCSESGIVKLTQRLSLKDKHCKDINLQSRTPAYRRRSLSVDWYKPFCINTYTSANIFHVIKAILNPLTHGSALSFLLSYIPPNVLFCVQQNWKMISL